MDVKIENVGSCMLLELTGKFYAGISVNLAERLESEIVKRAGSDPIDFDIIVNMEGVPTISSGGVCILLLLHNRLKAAGRRLAICGLQPLAAKVIDISGVLGLFDIYPSARDAKRSILGEPDG